MFPSYFLLDVFHSESRAHQAPFPGPYLGPENSWLTFNDFILITNMQSLQGLCTNLGLMAPLGGLLSILDVVDVGVVEVDLPARLGGLVRGGVGSASMTAADGIGGSGLPTRGVAFISSL